jgi:hypothetical protein
VKGPVAGAAVADGGDDDDGDYFARLRAESEERRRKAQENERKAREATIPAEPPPLPDVYVSDLTSRYLVVGWGGNPKKDLSIDNSPLRVAGKEYAKGIGGHSPSDLAFTIEPNYRRFVASAGLDDEIGGGSVAFQILLDGEIVRSSKTLRPKEIWHFNVEIPEGTKEIRLVITEGGNGDGCDHADWLNAGFVTE